MPRGHKGRRGRGGNATSGGGRPKANGGYSGGRGKPRFYKKRGRGGHRGLSDRDDSRGYSELDDLENADFVSVNAPQNSMRASAVRSSRNRRSRLQDEAFQTENNMANTMKLPLRKRPVEFIKAAIYDPSDDLIKRLSEKTNDTKEPGVPTEPEADSDTKPTEQIDPFEEVDTGNQEKYQVQEEEEEMVDSEVSIVYNTETAELEKEQKKAHSSKVIPTKHGASPHPIQTSPKKARIEKVSDDMLFFVDNEGEQNPKPVKEIQVDFRPKPIPATNLEHDSTMSIGKVLLTTSTNSKGEMFTSLPKNTKRLNNLNHFDASKENLSSSHGINDEEIKIPDSNTDLYKSYDEYIQNVIQNLKSDDEDDDDEDDEEDEYNPQPNDDDGEDIYDELDDDFEEEAKFIAGADSFDLDLDAITATAATVGNLTIDSDNDVVEEKEEPEYGFLPEDYETFDNTLVETIQMRYGSTANKYFLKCFQMTGTYDFQWIDQDYFEDFLLENGMPEHRMNAYLKFVEKQLTPVNEPKEEDYDLAISDSSSEEEEDYERGEIDDEEGLDTLIRFTQKYEGLRDMVVEPTQGLLSKRGKKKRELILENIDQEDLKRSLQAQFDIRVQNKREKRRKRDQNIAKEYANSKDLCLKYPYSLQITEIRDEFESFFQDKTRNSLSFPPMDPHGIRTIGKLAYYFNMKSRKFGQGTKAHAVVIKNKKTFRCEPDYHSAHLLTKQRPVFHRTDQKKPRTTVKNEKTKSNNAYFREGEIVGADAPEIAGDNVGRKLLMKMGWSSGQGLGADNRGVPDPVVAKVKKTKLGIR